MQFAKVNVRMQTSNNPSIPYSMVGSNQLLNVLKIEALRFRRASIGHHGKGTPFIDGAGAQTQNLEHQEKTFNPLHHPTWDHSSRRRGWA